MHVLSPLGLCRLELRLFFFLAGLDAPSPMFHFLNKRKESIELHKCFFFFSFLLSSYLFDSNSFRAKVHGSIFTAPP